MHHGSATRYGDLPPRSDTAVGLRGVLRATRTSLAWILLARQKPWLWLMGFLFLADVGVGGAAADVTINLVNHGIVRRDVPLWNYLTPTVVLGVLALVAGVGLQVTIGRVGYVVEFDLRSWVYTRVQNTPPVALKPVTSGQMLTRVQQDLAAVDEMIKLAPSLVAMIPLLIALTVVVMIQSPIMGVLAILALPVDIVILRRMRGRLRGLSWMELNESAEVTSAMVEPVLGIRVVHAFDRRHEHRSRLARVALRAYRVSMTKARVLARFNILLKSVPLLINAVALWVGASLVSGGRLSIGAFGFAIGLVTIITGAAYQIDQIAVAWQLARGSQDRFEELLRLPQVPEPAGTVTLPPPATGLRLDGVDVRFGDRPVLAGFDLHLRPGELVVVTGPPGAGKSTLAGVLAGHIAPDAGTVTVEGRPLSDLPTALMPVRVVGETSILFAGTVRDNVLLGVRDDLPDGELAAVLRASGAAEVVGLLDGGLDAAVGDRGLTLSGGQRQRIALARALATRPRVLVLDDALSAVQPALEIELIASLRAFDPTMSILFMTRRANATAVADAVVDLTGPPPGQVDTGGDTATEHDQETAEQLRAGARAAAGDSHLSLDPAMRMLVARMELTAETPNVRDSDIEAEPIVTGLFRPFRAAILLGFGFLVATTVTQTIPALMLGRITDQATNGDLSGTTSTAAVTAVLAVLAGVAACGYALNTGLLTNGVGYLLRRQVFHRVSSLGVDYYDRELPGQVATRVVTDVGQVNSFLLNSLLVLVVQVMTVAVSLAMIGVIAPSVAPTMLVFAASLVLLTLVGTRLGDRAYDDARRALGAVMARIEADFSGVLEIRNLGAVQAQTRRFAASSRHLLARRRQVVVVTSLYGQALTLVGRVASTIVLIQAGMLVLDGDLSIGLALAVQSLAVAATTPFVDFATQYNNAINTVVSWRRIKDFYRAPLLPPRRADAVPCPPLRGEITFDDVVFRYPGTDRTVLHGVSASIPAGAVVALVGYTGAGKSSIAKLLHRAYDPDVGAVRVDGADLRDLELTSYRHRVGIVPQDAFLFRGTVASNIGYGDPSATREQIVAAARLVGAADVIATLPGAFDAYVAEGGANLTGAQRQLIALARAWIVRPDVLVLDEATSALDAATERAVLDAVRALGCTTVAITHRESVVSIADHVLVIDAGRIVESGPRSRVVGAGGPHDRLWRVLPAPSPSIGAS